MKYEVEIAETLSKIIEVEANTADEAYEKVSNMYRNCEIVLSADDFVCKEIKVI